MERKSRSELTDAPYNPRTIDDHAKRKLRDMLKKSGLVMPPVWNRRTGNLVAGHQRIKILDQLEGTDGYSLDVAVVELSLKDEKRLNVFLNNQSAMGVWDTEKLEELLRDSDFDWTAAGFDRIDLEELIDIDVLKTIFPVAEPSPELARLMEQVDDVVADAVELRSEDRAVKRAMAEIQNGGAAAAEGESAEGQPADDGMAKILAARKAEREASEQSANTDYYLVCVFQDADDLMSFLVSHGLDVRERYITADRVIAAIKAKAKAEFAEAHNL